MHIPDGFLSTTTWISAWGRQPGDGPVGEMKWTAERTGGDGACRRDEHSALSAAAIAFFHTMLGPDHYLPFIAMSRAQGWSLARTATITTSAGQAMSPSAVLLGVVGITLGLAASFSSLRMKSGEAWPRGRL